MFIRRELCFRVFVGSRRRIGFDLEAVKRKLVLGRDDRCWNFEWNGISSHGRCNARRSYLRRWRSVVGITWAAAAIFPLTLNQKLHTSFDKLRPGLRNIKIFPLIVSDFNLRCASLSNLETENLHLSLNAARSTHGQSVAFRLRLIQKWRVHLGEYEHWGSQFESFMAF